MQITPLVPIYIGDVVHVYGMEPQMNADER
jgi:hypothetical protein